MTEDQPYSSCETHPYSLSCCHDFGCILYSLKLCFLLYMMRWLRAYETGCMHVHNAVYMWWVPRTQISFLLALREVIFLSNSFAILKFSWLFQPSNSSASLPEILKMHMKSHSVPHCRIFSSLHTYSGAPREAPFVNGLPGCPLTTDSTRYIGTAS